MNGRGGVASSAVQQRSHSCAARGDDFYPTCPEAVEALLRVEDLGGAIWEPACGDGAIVRVLEAARHPVVATDLVDRGLGGGVDFLGANRLLAPVIVTNPPFRLATQFARHAVDLGASRTYLLLRLVFLAGQGRRSFLRDHLARVWVFSKRLPRMHRDGWDGKQASSSVDFAWFRFDGKPVLECTVDWI